MLAKQLEYLADAQAAGIVVGARVPIAAGREQTAGETMRDMILASHTHESISAARANNTFSAFKMFL